MRFGNAGIILLSMVVGIGIGIGIANAFFVGDDVLRAARVIFGFFGVMIGGYLSSWLLTQQADRLRRKLNAIRHAA